MEQITSTPISNWVAERFYWVMIVILIINLMQRRYQDQAAQKRFATLYLAIGTFIIYVAAEFVRNYGFTDLVFGVVLVAVSAVLIVYRAHTFPFRLRSSVDGRWHTFNEILFDDEHGDGKTTEEATDDPSIIDGSDDGEPED